jgi:hypothetical protein
MEPVLTRLDRKEAYIISHTSKLSLGKPVISLACGQNSNRALADGNGSRFAVTFSAGFVVVVEDRGRSE